MNRPFVFINVAMTADGKIDTVQRKGAAISSQRDKERVDRLRAEADAVMVGGKTLLDEDPKLTVKSDALRAERHALGACLVILISVILVSAGLMYVVEHDAQPDKFGSTPDAIWWAAATVTTVGYGDVLLPLHWHLLAGIEGLTGILMAGWSTAALFAVITRMLAMGEQGRVGHPRGAP